MKVGILSESDADEAGIRVLAEAVLRQPLEVIQPVRVRSRGWAAVMGNLSSVYKALHWNPEAEGLIVMIDADETPVHDQSHDAGGFVHPDCRCCELHRKIVELQQHVAARQQAPLKVAIGLAVPAIEAWYQCGVDVHSTEPRFAREPKGALYELRRDLKRKCYGMTAAPQRVLSQKALEHAARLAQSLPLLEQNFPNGFGMLARALRSW